MFDDFKKFINSVLAERTATPLFTTFALSWSLWNWKILYITLFVGVYKYKEGLEKLQLILELINWCDSLLYPFLYTLFLLVVAPFVANGSYWLSLKYRKWRILKKENIIYSNRLLTKERGDQLSDEAQQRVERAEKVAESNFKQRQAAEHERDQAKEELDKLKSEKFRVPNQVLTASYGNDRAGWVDVKEYVNTIYQKAINSGFEQFDVTNKNFKTEGKGQDPAWTFWKDLRIVISHNGRFIQVNAIEGDTVGFEVRDEFKPLVSPGDAKRKMIAAVNDAKLPYYSNIKDLGLENQKSQ